MGEQGFSAADVRRLREHGLSLEEVERQLELFRNPPPFVTIDRAATVGDGIVRLTEAEIGAAREAYAAARKQGRIGKLVPASGAATRMFQFLLAVAKQAEGLERPEIERQAASGDAAARDTVAFIEGFNRFAFRRDLDEVMTASGLDAKELAGRGRFREILEFLLSPRGLDYASLPKGAIRFHRYADEDRTSFEEHLVDAARWLTSDEGACRVHFTISPEHRERFSTLASDAQRLHGERLGARFEVDFSIQDPSTDTVAVDLENRIFRDADGTPLFRPGGHGALIQNLEALRGDIVFIENIDNVAPDHRRDEPLFWKQVLCGHLLVVQRRIFAALAALIDEPGRAAIEEAKALCREVGISILARSAAGGSDAEAQVLRKKLDRPIRVCGMVRNVGEPGGGPFWVRGKDGTQTLQIVESAQIDPADPAQRDIFASATHFNPVEIACGLRNRQGELFQLSRYVDQEAVFIARKSKDGRDLKALERPGLWNGAMADWVTVFVEIPISIFNPVKTINDLLRAEHQPA